MADVKRLQRLPTGVPGLDVVLGGGFFETGVYIIEGPAGAGKTILANQICFHQAAQGKSAVYYTLLTEAHDRLLGFIRDLGFFDASMIPERITFVSGFKVLESEGLPGVLRSIRDTVSTRSASLLVVDGLVSAEEIAPNDTVFKKFIHEIQTISAMYRCTVLLLTNTEASKRLQAEHTMVDGIIELGAAVFRLKPHRFLNVQKFRGAGQLRGEHTLDLTNQGVIVRPRMESMFAPPDKQAALRQQTRRSLGIPAFDRLIGGGIPSASNTMVMGPSGTGKTLLGLHFLAAGLKAGENVLLFTFYEQAHEIVQKGSRFGIDLAGPWKSGQLQVVWQSSVEASVDNIGASLLGAFVKHKPSRILVDSMQGFQVTADPEERIEDFFAAISDYFIAEGATMMFTAETTDLLGDSLRPPFPNASRMCQNIFVMRHSEVGGKVVKVLSVFKMRDSDFDATVREVVIGSDGIRIGEPIAYADKLLGGQPVRVPRIDDGSRGR